MALMTEYHQGYHKTKENKPVKHAGNYCTTSQLHTIFSTLQKKGTNAIGDAGAAMQHTV